MTDRSALTRIAKSVAAESADRQLCEATQHVLRGLDEDPAHIFDLVDLLAKESNKKRPSDRMIGGYAFLLGHGLEVIRYGVERQDPAMIALVDGLRQHLLDAGNYGKIGAPMLLLILQQFAGAKVEIGDALQALMQDLMLQDVQANTVAKNGEAAEHFAHLAKALGKDAFAIHANLDENTETMPEAARVGMVMALFGDKEPALREAAIGYMLNASNLLRQKLIELLNLAAPQNLISPEMLRRMIAIRNWLPAADRSGLDTAIKAVRKSGVTCATWPRPIVREVFASGVDGSGAFTVLVIAEEAGRSHFAGLLIKQGFGPRLAIRPRKGLTRSQWHSRGLA